MIRIAKVALAQVVLFGGMMFAAALYAEATPNDYQKNMNFCKQSAEASYVVASHRSMSYEELDRKIEQEFPILDVIARYLLIESVLSSSWEAEAIRSNLIRECTSYVINNSQ